MNHFNGFLLSCNGLTTTTASWAVRCNLSGISHILVAPVWARISSVDWAHPWRRRADGEGEGKSKDLNGKK